MNKTICLSGIGLILSAIILGAFGAHALKEVLSAEKLLSFETGVKFLMYHGLAFLILGLQSKVLVPKIVFALMLTGIVFFSGSIFLLSIADYVQINMRFLGPITPIGGLLLIVSWIIFGFKLFKIKSW